jgi:hypothetical protein
MNSDISGLCSINACTRPATHEERGESAHWRFTVRYCDEHHREIEQGTPVGPVGIDASRIEVEAKGADEPSTGGILPSVGPA